MRITKHEHACLRLESEGRTLLIDPGAYTLPLDDLTVTLRYFLHADKAYDHQRCRRECRERNVIPHIARRGIEDSKRLERHRWVVERSLAWISRFRRLTVRYECRADIHLTFLACALIAFKQVERFC